MNRAYVVDITDPKRPLLPGEQLWSAPRIRTYATRSQARRYGRSQVGKLAENASFVCCAFKIAKRADGKFAVELLYKDADTFSALTDMVKSL